jgi:hypothetical protein
LLFGAFVTAASVLLLEATLRLAAPHSRGLRLLLYEPRETLAYGEVGTTPALLETTTIGFSPGEEYAGFCLNSRGFLTPEYDPVKPDQVERVVALGDSFTFKSAGVPFDAQWTTRLGPELAKRRGRPVEVINLGVPGVGPRFEFRLWQLEGRGLAPDVVVLAFFVGNDFIDETETLDRATRERGSNPHDGFLTASYAYRALRNFGRLVRAAPTADVKSASAPDEERRRARERRMGREDPTYPATYDDGKPSLPDDEYVRVVSERMLVTLRSRRMAFDTVLTFVARTLEALAAETAESGARLVVMLIPDEFQVDAGVRARVMAALGTHEEDHDVDLPQRELAAALTRQGIDVLDLLPTFREEGRRRRLYRPCDSHWNVAGNALAAERLAEHVARRR